MLREQKRSVIYFKLSTSNVLDISAMCIEQGHAETGACRCVKDSLAPRHIVPDRRGAPWADRCWDL